MEQIEIVKLGGHHRDVEGMPNSRGSPPPADNNLVGSLLNLVPDPAGSILEDALDNGDLEFFGSSAESVGDHRFRQVTKCMI